MEANNSCPLAAFKAKLTEYRSKVDIPGMADNSDTKWPEDFLRILGLDTSESNLVEHFVAGLRTAASRIPFPDDQDPSLIPDQEQIALTKDLAEAFKAAVDHSKQTGSDVERQVIDTFLGSLR